MAGLRLVSPEQLIAGEQQQAADAVAAETRQTKIPGSTPALVAFIDNEFRRFQRHRDSASGWSDRLTTAMRVFSGVYDITKLAGNQTVRWLGNLRQIDCRQMSRSNQPAPRHLPQSGKAVGAEAYT